MDDFCKDGLWQLKCLLFIEFVSRYNWCLVVMCILLPFIVCMTCTVACGYWHIVAMLLFFAFLCHLSSKQLLNNWHLLNNYSHNNLSVVLLQSRIWSWYSNPRRVLIAVACMVMFTILFNKWNIICKLPHNVDMTFCWLGAAWCSAWHVAFGCEYRT